MAHPKLWGITDTRNGLPTTTRESPGFSHGECQTIKKGEAIGQGIFELMTVFEEYDKKHTLNERRTGGFGSTDK